MIRLLMCGTNYDGIWAADTLLEVIRPGMKAGILPLSGSSGYSSDMLEWADTFADEGVYVYDLKRPLLSYGIRPEDIEVLDHYRLERFEPERYDILILAGEDAHACMERLEDLGITGKLKYYRGILIGLSAGAEIMTEVYRDVSGELYPGLAVTGGFIPLMHYDRDADQIRQAIHLIEYEDLPVILVSEDGGILADDDGISLFGEACVCTDRDLDMLYSMYDMYV